MKQKILDCDRFAKPVGLIFAVFLLISCSGPQPLQVAIGPVHRQAYYDALQKSSDVRQAHWVVMAAAKSRTVDQLKAEDHQLSQTHNPFDAYRDSEAVSRGAVIFEMHCMSCHGERADGLGPKALPNHRPKNFHSFGYRLASTLHRGTPRAWFKKIHDGFGEEVEYPEGKLPAMPAFGDKLTREQIWMVTTYLQSLDVHAKKQSENKHE